jgi:hypothetical protein
MRPSDLATRETFLDAGSHSRRAMMVSWEFSSNCSAFSEGMAYTPRRNYGLVEFCFPVSSAMSQALAILQSRFAVPTETPSASAVSSISNPPK